MWRLWTRGFGVRDWWYWFRTQGFPMWMAFHVPRWLAYWCFIRVHEASEAHWSFDAVARAWRSKSR